MIGGIWRLLVAMIWFGVMFAVCTVIVAGSLVAVIGAIGSGALMPSRSVRGQLRSLVANVEAAIALIRALR